MRIIYSCFLIIACLFALTAPASYAGALKVLYVPCKTVPTDMDLVEVGKVKEVLRANQLQLENGAVFILDNIRVPVPYERDAREFLETLVKGKTVGLYSNKTLPQAGQADAHGNEIVHVVVDDGTWVQQTMVAKGYAWVDSTPNNRDCVNTLYKSEVVARAKKLGFWAAPEYKIHDHNSLNGTMGTFILFEGVPKVYRPYGEYDFYGFGYGESQTQRSFTIALKKSDEWMFSTLVPNPQLRGFYAADLAHTRMRIRGWVEPFAISTATTPMIRLTHPEQLEFPEGLPGFK